MIDSFAQWVKVSGLTWFYFSVRTKNLSNQIQFKFFTYPSQSNNHLVFDVQRNLNEWSAILSLRHLFRFANFNSIFNIIKVFWRIQELDIRNAHSQVFNIYISVSTRLWCSRLSWTQSVSHLLPSYWLKCERVYNFEMINASKRAFLRLDCLKRDKHLVRLNEWVNNHILGDLQVVCRVQC